MFKRLVRSGPEPPPKDRLLIFVQCSVLSLSLCPCCSLPVVPRVLFVAPRVLRSVLWSLCSLFLFLSFCSLSLYRSNHFKKAGVIQWLLDMITDFHNCTLGVSFFLMPHTPCFHTPWPRGMGTAGGCSERATSRLSQFSESSKHARDGFASFFG